MADRLNALLLRPFLPAGTRLRLRQQHFDEEATRRSRPVLATPDLSVALAEAGVRGGAAPSPGSIRAVPRVPDSPGRPRPDSEPGRWAANGLVRWNGTQVVAVGDNGVIATWDPEPGGLLPGYDAAEVAAAGIRPVTSGDSSPRIAAIATVGLAGHHVHRVYFLDAESRELSSLPALWMPLDGLARVAEAAGIDYRRYVLTLAKFSSLRVLPGGLCEVLFPRSVHRVLLEAEAPVGPDGWYSETRFW